MDLNDVLNAVQSSSLRLVRFLFCDTSSIIRGKATHISKFKERIECGIGLVKGTLAMNMLDELIGDTGLGPVGEVRLVPDISTFTILPYVNGAAAVLCDLQELDHRPWALCARGLLKRVIEDARKLGLSFEAAFEPEFMLGKMIEGEYVPIDEGLCFSTESMNQASDFISAFVEALVAQHIEIEQYYPELGAGQHELSIKHTGALSACDRQIIYRETLKGMAWTKGLNASLAPKPFLDQPGNGCHLHLSAWDVNSRENLFWSADGLSQFGRQFVAGLLAHLPALVAVTCASVNSYRRLKPQSWSSAYVCWGFENREAAVRVPSLYWGHEKDSSNLEIKCVDSTCNPYLAMAAVIAAGLDGVNRRLEPPQPVAQDPSLMDAAQKQRHGVERLPETLNDALIALEGDEYLKQKLGPEMVKNFLAVKYSECRSFAAQSPEYELKHHRLRF